MKTMKTCKVGCGKMKAGGPVKKVKKMQPGGTINNNFGMPYNGIPFAPTNGNTDPSKNQMGTNATMKKGGPVKKMAKGGFPDLNKDGKVTKADVLKGRGVFKKGGTKKYLAGENPNPSGKSIAKQAGVFGGALAALVGLTREKGIERRAKKAEERYDKRQVKKQVKAEIKEAKNMPKSKMGGMTKSKKK